MGRLSSSWRSINEAVTSAAPVLESPALAPAVPANDRSEIESASKGLGKTKRLLLSIESADRMLGRGAQMGRGEWRPVWESRSASLETLTGSDGGVTD